MKERLKYLRKCYTIADYYLSYIDYIDKGTLYDIDFKTFKAIITDYFKYIANLIMYNSAEVKLPCRLGTLSIIKHKPKEFTNKSLRWDWKATKEIGKPVYLLNEHSDYYKYRFYWNKKNSLLTNKTKYLFIASRSNKRMLATIIKTHLQDYVEL